jgi:hypothetical protein
MMALSVILGKAKHPRHAALHSFMFAVGSLLALLGVSLGLQYFFNILPVGVVGYAVVVLSVLITLFGLLEVKDYFWYGKGLSFKLTVRAEHYLHEWTKTHHGAWRGFLLGVVTTLRLSHYTVLLIALIVAINSLLQPDVYAVPIVWSVFYSLPPMFIAVLLLFGVDAHGLVTWKEQSKHTMRLSIGLVYILFGLIALTVLLGGIRLV